MNDTKIDDGGPAFPVAGHCVDASGAYCGDVVNSKGLSLRDYAIIHFMAALMQRDDFDIETGKLVSVRSAISPRLLAAEQADAMIVARKA